MSPVQVCAGKVSVDIQQSRWDYDLKAHSFQRRNALLEGVTIIRSGRRRNT
jgi:hypothetical protein